MCTRPKQKNPLLIRLSGISVKKLQILFHLNITFISSTGGAIIRTPENCIKNYFRILEEELQYGSHHCVLRKIFMFTLRNQILVDMLWKFKDFIDIFGQN